MTMLARICLLVCLVFPVVAAADDAGVLVVTGHEGSGSALLDAGSASAPVDPAPVVTVSPAASDVSVMTKLYKNGSFFGLGIMALFVGLSLWSRLDKKRAFYAATAMGGLAVLVESIRRGDTPSATMAFSAVLPTVGIMIAGPGHTKAGV